MRAPVSLGLAIIVAAGAGAWATSSTNFNTPVEKQETGRTIPLDRIALSPEQWAAARASGELLHEVRSLLKVEGKLRYGDYVWNDRGIEAGPTWIRADLQNQIISVFRSGHEIGTAVIVYGADEKRTPAGEFPVLAKIRDHRSSLYDAEMPYTLRLTGDGISIHGSEVKARAATHGCIGVPPEFARKLFEAASVGDRVVITT